MIKYATALRLGTADADTILKRFTRSQFQHPTYRAITELGKAMKTVFLCQYRHKDALRREINDGLQVVENWHSANDFIFFGKGVKSPRTGSRTRNWLCSPCICYRLHWSTSIR